MNREPPSRATNPFATCWTHPGALPFLESTRGGVEAVLARTRRAGWRGLIVGPHGAGKSTLLAALADPLRRAGVEPIAWNAAQGVHACPGGLLLVEGFERLSLWDATRHLARWRRSGQAFLATVHGSHAAWRLAAPVVCRLQPDRDLLRGLFQRLTADRPTPVTLAQAEASFSRRRGNLRDVWFDLYDLHEGYSRCRRTKPVVASYVGPRGESSRPAHNPPVVAAFC